LSSSSLRPAANPSSSPKRASRRFRASSTSKMPSPSPPSFPPSRGSVPPRRIRGGDAGRCCCCRDGTNPEQQQKRGVPVRSRPPCRERASIAAAEAKAVVVFGRLLCIFFLSFFPSFRFVSFRFEIKSARIGPRKFNFCGNRFSFFSVFSKGISRRMYVWVGLRMLCGSQSMFGDECLSGSDPSRYHLSRPLSARRRQNCSAAAAVRVLFDAFSIKGSGIDNR